MTNVLCPIWQTHAVLIEEGFDDRSVRSDRAGGSYKITGTAGGMVKSLSPRDKTRLTSWIVEQLRAGVPLPVVGSDQVRLAKTRQGLKHSQRVTRFFEMLNYRDWKLSDSLKIAGPVDDKYTSDRAQLAAWTELEDVDKEMSALVGLLSAEGFVNSSYEITLTPKGFAELERLQSGGADSSNAFVAMWFDASMDAAYERGIEPALRRAGYLPIRIDKKEHNNKIDDEIIADIKRSRFIVADFTCATITDASGTAHCIPRGGVYFEAGFAYGLGLPVIWVCREDHMNLVHFDTNHFAHILWKTPEDLETRLFNRIVHVVGLGPSAV